MLDIAAGSGIIASRSNDVAISEVRDSEVWGLRNERHHIPAAFLVRVISLWRVVFCVLFLSTNPEGCGVATVNDDRI